MSLGKKVLKVEQLQDWWIYHLIPGFLSLLNCLQCVTLSLGWPPSGSRDDYHNLRGCILHVNFQRNQRRPSFPCISFFRANFCLLQKIFMVWHGGGWRQMLSRQSIIYTIGRPYHYPRFMDKETETEKLSNTPSLSLLISGKTGVWTKAVWLYSTCSYPMH